MTDSHQHAHATNDRPNWACQTHRPPTGERGWVPADQSYRTCSDCLDKLRANLRDIARRYQLLNPRPGNNTETAGRGAPGFRSAPAASLHIIAMRDPRSRSHEVSSDGVQYILDPTADDILQPGQYGPARGMYVDKQEVWYGADGRGHQEESNPVRSIPHTIGSLAELIAEQRDMTAPTGPVPSVITWLDNQLDWLTRTDLVADFNDDIRALVRQLEPVTGNPGRRHIGRCPNLVPTDAGPVECGARLYAPLRGDEIQCRQCERTWPREEWLRLGDLLEAS